MGPRKKLNNAIARWHSNARPASDDLEQAYTDRMEAEMQEMAIELHRVRTFVSFGLLHEREVNVTSLERAQCQVSSAFICCFVGVASLITGLWRNREGLVALCLAILGLRRHFVEEFPCVATRH